MPNYIEITAGTTVIRDLKKEKEDILCNLTRADQQGEEEFICEAYEEK